MSDIRGWPRMRPYRSCTATSNAIRSRAVRTLLLLAAFVATTAGAHASVFFTNDPADVNPTEAVYLTGINALWEGTTPSGLRYRITQNQGDQLYSNHYNAEGSPVRNTLRIEFDRPVAAIGAQLMVSGFAAAESTAGYQSNTPFAYVSDNGYYGLVSNKDGFREATFVSTSGPLSISRVEVRPLPCAIGDSLSAYENSQHAFDAAYILSNDFQADGALLVSAPLHADFFQLNADGSFIYRPAKNYQGLDSFLYRATNGNGAAASEPATVTLQVLPLNCPPTFTPGPDVTCREDDGMQSLSRWATAMASGPEDEPSQSLDWQITTNHDSLFAIKPAIDADGNLTFQPALHENGSAQVTVSLHDDGGTLNGGLDTSDAMTFTITVEPKEHSPVLESVPDTVIRQGDALVLKVKGSEVDAGIPLLYSLQQAPAGASIDLISGQVVWRPAANFSGNLVPFIVRATETGSECYSTTTSFQVEVLPAERAPEIAPIQDIQVEPNTAVHLKISSKASGVRFFLASQVPGAALDPNTGDFTWKPLSTNAGNVYRFEVSALSPASSNLCAVRTFAVRVAGPIVSKPNNLRIAARTRLQTAGQAAMHFGEVGKAKTMP